VVTGVAADDLYQREALEHEFDPWQTLSVPGGMAKRAGPTLAERAARSRPTAGSPVKHCWVINPPEAVGTWPGLVLGWRRSGEDDRWTGRAVYAVTPAPTRCMLLRRTARP